MPDISRTYDPTYSNVVNTSDLSSGLASSVQKKKSIFLGALLLTLPVQVSSTSLMASLHNTAMGSPSALSHIEVLEFSYPSIPEI